MCEYSEFVSVVTVQTILRPEPHESLIVLYDLKNSGLGQALSSGEPREADIIAVDYGKSDAKSPAARLLGRI